MRHIGIAIALGTWGMACMSFAQTPAPEIPVKEVVLWPVESSRADNPSSFVHRSEEDLVLVDVKLGRMLLAESIPGYSDKGALLLPLGQITETLQFPIEVNVKNGQANGWFLDRSNRFSLDVERREVIIAGSNEAFDADRVELHEDDIYVDTTLLARWFPLMFNFSFSTQTVSIMPRGGVLLPVQQEGARQKMRVSLGSRDKEDSVPLPLAHAPYQLFSLPFADITYNAGTNQQGQNGFTNQLNVIANHDLFYMQSNIFLDASTPEGLNDLRWALSRRDPDGRLFREENLKDNAVAQAFNRAGVRELAIGDVYTQQLPLTAFNQQGRGIVISTKPYDRATQFNRTTLQGDLLPGWEVELYRNDELLDFQRASANGRYEFIDVPLLSGLNIIRLVFYGPFGQKREEVQRFNVSPNIAEAGKSYFRIALGQQNTGLFDLRNDALITGIGVTPSEQDMVKGEARLLMEYEYGLRENMSLFSSVAHLTTGDGIARNYAGAGVAASLAGIYARLDTVREFEGAGHAFQLDLEDNLFGISLAGQHQQFYDFLSEFTESVGDPVTARTILRADTPLAIPLLPHMNTGVSALRTAYLSGKKRYEINSRLSAAIERMAISHTLAFVREFQPLADDLNQMQGNAIISIPLYDVILRSNIGYIMTPDFSVNSVALTAEYYFNRDTLTRFEVNRDTATTTVTTYTAAINRKFDRFLLGANIRHSDDGENAIGVTLSLSIGEEPRRDHLQMYPDYSARDGFVSARVFHDKDADGLFNHGDMPVENARFRINRGSDEFATSEDGTLLLRNIPADIRTRVMLDTDSLENPYLSPAIPGMEVIARPGMPVAIEIPVVSTSDVEGTAYLQSKGGKPAANVQIEVVDKAGAVVQETRTAFDGYYLISTLPIGSYTLRISPEQKARLQFKDDGSKAIFVTGEEDAIGPIDFIVKRD